MIFYSIMMNRRITIEGATRLDEDNQNKTEIAENKQKSRAACSNAPTTRLFFSILNKTIVVHVFSVMVLFSSSLTLNFWCEISPSTTEVVLFGKTFNKKLGSLWWNASQLIHWIFRFFSLSKCLSNIKKNEGKNLVCLDWPESENKGVLWNLWSDHNLELYLVQVTGKSVSWIRQILPLRLSKF